MPIKLVAVDMDGTLLNEQKKITPRTQRAVRDAIAHGLDVVFCTGRPLCECDEAIAALPEVRYLVSSNGARIWDLHENRVLAEHCFAPERSLQLVERLLPFDGLVAVFTGTRITMRKDWETRIFDVFPPVIAAHTAKYHHPDEALLDYAAGKHGAVEKVFCIFVSEAERDRAWDAIRDIPSDIVVSAEDNLEVTEPGINKGAGLAELARLLGLAREEIMAVGDSRNDTSMLSYAGFPAAMGNADPKLKTLARLVLPTNEEDGVAWALDRLTAGTL